MAFLAVLRRSVVTRRLYRHRLVTSRHLHRDLQAHGRGHHHRRARNCRYSTPAIHPPHCRSRQALHRPTGVRRPRLAHPR